MENGTQKHDNSSEFFELGQQQEIEMISTDNGFFTSEVTNRLANEQIKLATEPIFTRVEDLCALLASRKK